GQLVAVINSDGSATKYHYDAVGNITGIESIDSDELAILSFSPSHAGPVGSGCYPGCRFQRNGGKKYSQIQWCIRSPRISNRTLCVAHQNRRQCADIRVFWSHFRDGWRSDYNEFQRFHRYSHFITTVRGSPRQISLMN